MVQALESCRHIVVVLSQAFLTKPHPCAELVYAYRRMEWLRKRYQNEWQSVWVVLYDISLSEYKQVRKETGERLPAIHKESVLLQYHEDKKKYESWIGLCHQMIHQILKHDQERATKHWRAFLESWCANSFVDDPFPRAGSIYELTPEETGCRTTEDDNTEEMTRIPSALVAMTDGVAARYSRAVDIDAKLNSGKLGMVTELMDYYRRGALVKTLLSLALPENQVFVLGFDGVPEELSGYLGKEEYLTTFRCWIVDQFLDLVANNDSSFPINQDLAIPFLNVCYGWDTAFPSPQHIVGWNEPSVRVGEVLTASQTMQYSSAMVRIVGTCRDGTFLLARCNDLDYFALGRDGVPYVVIFENEEEEISTATESFVMAAECIFPELIKGILACRGNCRWDEAAWFGVYFALVLREFSGAIADLPAQRQAPTRRRLQQLVKLQQEGVRRNSLGFLVRSALKEAERRLREDHDQLISGGMIVTGCISQETRKVLSNVFQEVSISTLRTRIDHETLRGQEEEVRWRTIEGSGTENITVVAAFMSKLVNDISAEETLTLNNISAGVKVVIGKLGSVATWPGAGGIIVDATAKDPIEKKSWLSPEDSYTSVFNHSKNVCWPLVTAALVKAFLLENSPSVRYSALLDVLNDSPAMMFRPFDVIATRHLGRFVSLTSLSQACESMFGIGKRAERACCLRLCVESLVLANCELKGTLGRQLPASLKHCIRPATMTPSILLCDKAIPTDGLLVLETGHPVDEDVHIFVLFKGQPTGMMAVVDAESGDITTMPVPAKDPDLRNGAISPITSKVPFVV